MADSNYDRTVVQRELNRVVLEKKGYSSPQIVKLQKGLTDAILDDEKNKKLSYRTYGFLIIATLASVSDSSLATKVNLDALWLRAGKIVIPYEVALVEVDIFKTLKEKFDEFEFYRYLYEFDLRLKQSANTMHGGFRPYLELKCEFFLELRDQKQGSLCWDRISKLSPTQFNAKVRMEISMVRYYMAENSLSKAIMTIQSLEKEKIEPMLKTELSFLKGRILLYQGKYSEFLKETKAIIASGENKSPFFLPLAEAEVSSRTGDCKKAVGEATKISSNIKTSGERVNIRLAQIFAQCGEFEKANDLLNKIHRPMRSGTITSLYYEVVTDATRILSGKTKVSINLQTYEKYEKLLNFVKVDDPLSQSLVNTGKILAASKDIASVDIAKLRNASSAVLGKYDDQWILRILINKILSKK